MAFHRFFSVLLFIGFIAILVACSTSPTGRNQFILVSDSQMDELGEQSFEQLKSSGNVSTQTSVNRYVQCVSNHITRVVGGQWEVVVFDDETANAFALPGGKIGVHTGLLEVAENQHQLAAVIGHEVGHVLAEHGAERVSQQLGTQAVLGILSGQTDSRLALGAIGLGAQVGGLAFSRTHESEADVLGLEYMAKAGFDPAQSITLWENMAAASNGRPPEILSTHPAPETRMSQLREMQPQARLWFNDARASGRSPDC